MNNITNELLNDILHNFEKLNEQRKLENIKNLDAKTRKIYNKMKKGKKVDDIYILYFS